MQCIEGNIFKSYRPVFISLIDLPEVEDKTGLIKCICQRIDVDNLSCKYLE